MLSMPTYAEYRGSVPNAQKLAGTVGNNDCKNRYPMLAAELNLFTSSLKPITGTHMLSDTSNIIECTKK